LRRAITRELCDDGVLARAELETQLLLAAALGYLPEQDSKPLLGLCLDVARQLESLSHALRSKARKC
jgi:hypothetical protein